MSYQALNVDHNTYNTQIPSNLTQGRTLVRWLEYIFVAIIYMIIAVSINQTIYKKDNENDKLIHRTTCQVISLNITKNTCCATCARFDFSVVRANDNQTFYDTVRCGRDKTKYSVGTYLKCYYHEHDANYFSWHDYKRNEIAYQLMIVFFVLMCIMCVAGLITWWTRR